MADVVNDQAGQQINAQFQAFVQDFEDEEQPVAEGDEPKKLYLHRLHLMHEHDGRTLMVDYRHLMRHGPQMAQAIAEDLYRFSPFLNRAVQTLMAHIFQDFDVSKDLFVGFYSFPEVVTVRQLRMDRVGQLSAVAGTVTRTSDVRPELYMASFKCLKCQSDHNNVLQQFTYTTPVCCAQQGGARCDNTQNWSLNLDQCSFVDWQRVRVQENADEIPAGSMPRSLDIIVRNELCEQPKAGDKASLRLHLVVVDADPCGLCTIGCREMAFKTSFVATGIQTPEEHQRGEVAILGEEVKDKPREEAEQEREEIEAMKATKDLYKKMAESLAPNIFGHLEVKKGILLMLMGGVHKVTAEGINLRGDLNVCLLGDPSTAKSQFLKFVHGFWPRGVFASGKASSAAGLTASVVKDGETGEFCVEAGALMLADNGICCIDEFDKMDPKDQVAIHEAMEQQTISITKAGIHATLNARTSILAAANPIYGRYDRSKPLKANVQIPPPIMSRFDLFFVILDECKAETDELIAKHIVAVHQGREEVVKPYFQPEQIRRYIRAAQAIDPIITPEARQAMVQAYRDLRQNDNLGQNRTAYRITVRQLESMIRLSEALARLDMDTHVKPRHVMEAQRLLKQSIIHVATEDVTLYEEEEEEGETMMMDDGEDEEEHGHGGGGGDDDDDGGGNDENGGGGPGNRRQEERGPDDDDEDAMGDGEGKVKKTAKKKHRSKKRKKHHEGDKEEGGGGGEEQEEGDEGEHHHKKKKKKKRRKVQISLDEFACITTVITTYLRKMEASETDLTWVEVVDWFVNETPEEERDESLRDKLDLIIARLIDKDQYLVLAEQSSQEVDRKKRKHNIVRVHPNFDPTSSIIVAKQEPATTTTTTTTTTPLTAPTTTSSPPPKSPNPASGDSDAAVSQ